MSLFKQFKMDEDKETKGVKITYGANDDGSVPSFTVLRRNSTNQQYQKVLDRETAQFRRQIALGTLDRQTSEAIFRKVFCTAILIGWENIQDENGKPIPFNRDNAIHLFEKLPELYEDLFVQSGNASLFRLSTAEDEAKNS